MGLRSWFTQVDSFDIFKKVVNAIKNNSNAYGINFILKLKNSDGKWFLIVVALLIEISNSEENPPQKIPIVFIN